MTYFYVFKNKSRLFPIDLGYPISNIYSISIDLKGAYEVVQLPSNKKIKLADDVGECSAFYNYKDGKISLRFSFKLNNTHFAADEYQGLKFLYECY